MKLLYMTLMLMILAVPFSLANDTLSTGTLCLILDKPVCSNGVTYQNECYVPTGQVYTEGGCGSNFIQDDTTSFLVVIALGVGAYFIFKRKR